MVITPPRTASATVRSAIVGTRQLDFIPYARPERTGPAQILTRTRCTLVSPGTELALYEGVHAGLADPGNAWAKYPFEPGYAAVGEVVEAGDAAGDVRPGDLLFYWGRHASWGLIDPTQEVVVPVPDGLDPRHALFARLAQIAATGVVRLPLRPATVLVMGAGLVGILAAQQFRLAGADVAVQDVNPKRLAFAAACGLKTLIAGEDFKAPFGGVAPACVVEATGVRGLVVHAMRAVAYAGAVVALGVPGGMQEINLYAQLFVKGLLLLGAHEGTVPLLDRSGGHSRQSMTEAAMAAVADGRIAVAPLLTSVFPARRLGDAYEALSTDKDHHLGTVIDWTENAS